MLDAFATGDATSAAEYVAERYHDHQGLRGREMHGVSGFVEVVETARRAFVSLGLGVEDLIVDDDRAAARIRWHGKLVTGEVVDRETIDIIRVADGCAVDHWGAQAWTNTIGTAS